MTSRRDTPEMCSAADRPHLIEQVPVQRCVGRCGRKRLLLAAARARPADLGFLLASPS